MRWKDVLSKEKKLLKIQNGCRKIKVRVKWSLSLRGRKIIIPYNIWGVMGIITVNNKNPFSSWSEDCIALGRQLLFHYLTSLYLSELNFQSDERQEDV
jgi:hypothetical protein